jgi:hypothetical protein
VRTVSQYRLQGHRSNTSRALTLHTVQQTEKNMATVRNLCDSRRNGYRQPKNIKALTQVRTLNAITTTAGRNFEIQSGNFQVLEIYTLTKKKKKAERKLIVLNKLKPLSLSTVIKTFHITFESQVLSTSFTAVYSRHITLANVIL